MMIRKTEQAGTKAAALALATALLAATASTDVQAAATMPALPAGTQLASVEYPLSCRFPVAGVQTLRFRLTATAPTVVASGQSFKLSDVSMRVLVPDGLVQLIGGVLTTKTLNINVAKLPIIASGAVSATFNGLDSKLQVTGAPVTPGEPTYVDIPQSGFVTIGPVKTGRRTGTVYVSVGIPTATIYLKGVNGGPTFVPLRLNCQGVSDTTPLLAVQVATGAAEVADFHSGVRSADLTDEALDRQYIQSSAARSCTFGNLGSRDVTETSTGLSPYAIPQGGSFSISDRRGQLKIPAATVNDLLAVYPGAVSVDGTITGLDYTAAGAAPDLFDIANLQPVALAPADLQADQDASIAYPYDSGLTVGPFSAAGFGRNVALGSGPLTGSLNFRDSNGAAVGAALPLSCSAPDPAPVINSLTQY